MLRRNRKYFYYKANLPLSEPLRIELNDLLIINSNVVYVMTMRKLDHNDLESVDPDDVRICAKVDNNVCYLGKYIHDEPRYINAVEKLLNANYFFVIKRVSKIYHDPIKDGKFTGSFMNYFAPGVLIHEAYRLNALYRIGPTVICFLKNVQFCKRGKSIFKWLVWHKCCQASAEILNQILKKFNILISPV